MLKKESKMAGRVNPNGPTRSRALLPPAMLGLGLLAAMAGHASAELGCSDPRDSKYGYSYLIDTEYCHITELNAAFDGLLTGCDGDGLVRRVLMKAKKKKTAIQHACRGRGMNGTTLHPHSGTPGCCTRRSMP